VKAEKFILSSELIRDNALNRIKEIELNGKTTVTISDTGSKSARQRALNWVWNENVAESGFGGRHEDTKAGVHRLAKYRWALPILIRDKPNFADLYSVYRQLYEGDQEKMVYFIDEHIHTEHMSISQVAEFLSEFQNYYLGHGVALVDPELKLLER